MRQLPRPAQLYLACCYLVGVGVTVWLFAPGGTDAVIDGLVAGGLALAAGLLQVILVRRFGVETIAPRSAGTAMLLAGCYALGIGLAGWPFAHDGAISLTDWLLAAGLGVAAAGAQIFVVQRAGTNYSDHLTPAPIFAAILLLPRPLLPLVVWTTFVAEGIWYRRLWYIALFNIATWTLAAAGARETLAVLTGVPQLRPGTLVPAFAVVAAMPVFGGIITTTLAGALRVARGMSVRESQLFVPTKLLTDAALACCGWAFAAAWNLDPVYGLGAAMPLVLIFQALRIPNLEKEATTDPKTGLANMRYFNAQLAQVVKRARRSGRIFSLLMCDMDYLRTVNNTYGHQAGDLVIAGIATAIRQSIRSTDVGARFGGEEFVVLLPETPAEGAARVAERIRSQVEQARYTVDTSPTPIGATVSIGIATFPGHGDTSDAVLRAADQAVYQAKEQGRNRVVIAPAGPPAPNRSGVAPEP